MSFVCEVKEYAEPNEFSGVVLVSDLATVVDDYGTQYGVRRST